VQQSLQRLVGHLIVWCLGVDRRIGANADGRREVLGMAVGPSKAEPFWTKFLRSLTERGLRGVKLVISDSHEGLKKAARKVLGATWPRCSVHFMRNALANVNVKQRGMSFDPIFGS